MMASEPWQLSPAVRRIPATHSHQVSSSSWRLALPVRSCAGCDVEDSYNSSSQRRDSRSSAHARVLARFLLGGNVLHRWLIHRQVSSKTKKKRIRCIPMADAPPSYVSAKPMVWPRCSVAPEILAHVLPENPDMLRGVLPNGLRYVICRNSTPQKRFEAHLDIHAGSVDEEDHQQGMAHMLEHICFLGSSKRTRLFGSGARSNALTDFQHTVYHVHSPVTSESGRDLLTPALEALQDIAFAPNFYAERIEQERKAVLNEMQQVNTLEYRIETWTLAGLHSENQLGRRFPIGLEEQIRRWSVDECKAFHEKWYYPGNATLYLVGDMPEQEMLSTAKRIFASTPAKKLSDEPAPAWGPQAMDPTSLSRRMLSMPRPKHLHAFTVPQIGTEGDYTAARGDPMRVSPITVIHHELLNNVQIYMYAKAPVRPIRTIEDLRYACLPQLIVSVLRLRILVLLKYGGHNAEVGVDHSDSHREGCAVTSLQVTADSSDWYDVLFKVIQEVRAIVEHGITEGEFQRFSSALQRQAEKDALEAGSMSSEDLITHLMSSDTFGHAVMHPRDVQDTNSKIQGTLSLEEVKPTAEWMLGFLAHFGREGAAPPSAVVACMPTKTYDDAEGKLVELPRVTEEALHRMLRDVPSKDVSEALNPVEIPEALCPEESLQALLGSNYIDRMRAYLAGARRVDPDTGVVQLRLPNGARVNYMHTKNASQGSLRLLFPGGRAAEPPGKLGIAALGARALEDSGTVADFTNQQVELFAVTTGLCVEIVSDREHIRVDSTYPVSQKESLGANLQLLHLLLREPSWEPSTFERAQQACKSKWQEVFGSLELATEEAFLSAMYPNDKRVLMPSQEQLSQLGLSEVRAFTEQIMFNEVDHMEVSIVQDFEMLGRALSPATGKAQRLTNAEGEEFTDEEHKSEIARFRAHAERATEEDVWRFLGSVERSKTEVGRPEFRAFESSGLLEDNSKPRRVHLQDPEERAVAIVGGSAPNNWGLGDARHSDCMMQKGFSWEWDASRPSLTSHKLFPSVCMLLLKTIIAGRLNGTLREGLGLVYSVKFELSLFNVLRGGWFQAIVSSHPSRIHEALQAAKKVIMDVKHKPISAHEVASARQSMQRRHESDLHTNEQWITLLSHLQTENTQKDVSCIRDVLDVLQQVQAGDVQNAYKALTVDDQLFEAIGTQGPASKLR
eukprot:TRINITY_DN104800_c0_g1_i1.p1 TRINITY_DN104800_c0_g1~~TRINITY_DN104800_c0_g1_i1.p1  ORF type:complete len:1184 (+),score=166.75 TRINITY_DN104800_c0_g1_i1:55-3606(+)